MSQVRILPGGPKKDKNMAKKRMFSESVVESDFFLDLPLTSQALYFHIGMRADDDGICASSKTVMRIVGSKPSKLSSKRR